MKAANYSLGLMAFFMAISISGLAQNNKESALEKAKASQQAASSKTQLFTYYFSKFTDTYTELTGATSLNNGEIWDDPIYKIPLGFTFMFDGLPTDTLYLGGGLGALLSNQADGSPNPSLERFMGVFEADLIDRGDINGQASQSPMSYKTEGTPGSRITKIEWQNAGFYEEGVELSTYDDFVNFQAWIYEGSNNFEVRFGPSSITSGANIYEDQGGPFIGAANFNDDDYFVLTGPPTNPVVVDTIDFINGTPIPGYVYRFSTSPASVDEVGKSATGFSLYPNPATTSLNLKTDELGVVAYVVYDIAGRQIYSGNFAGVKELDIASWPNGVYTIQFQTEAGIITNKWVKR